MASLGIGADPPWPSGLTAVAETGRSVGGPLRLLYQRVILTLTDDGTPRMKQFKWIEWNLQKIDAHGLSAEEVEAAFDRVFSLQERRDDSFEMFAATPSGRRIWVISRYDLEDDEIADVFGELGEVPIFVITAY